MHLFKTFAISRVREKEEHIEGWWISNT